MVKPSRPSADAMSTAEERTSSRVFSPLIFLLSNNGVHFPGYRSHIFHRVWALGYYRREGEFNY